MKKILSVIVALALIFGTNVCTMANTKPTPTPTKAILGGRLILTKLCTVYVTFIRSDASYNSSFGLFAPSKITLGYGHFTRKGMDLIIGDFEAGTELIFCIHPYNNGTDLKQTFYSGDASKNIDKIVHASYKQISDSKWYLGFEDTYNGGDKDYNDIELYVWTSTINSAYILPPGCTPRPTPKPTKNTEKHIWRIDIR